MTNSTRSPQHRTPRSSSRLWYGSASSVDGHLVVKEIQRLWRLSQSLLLCHQYTRSAATAGHVINNTRSARLRWSDWQESLCRCRFRLFRWLAWLEYRGWRDTSRASSKSYQPKTTTNKRPLIKPFILSSYRILLMVMGAFSWGFLHATVPLCLLKLDQVVR